MGAWDIRGHADNYLQQENVHCETCGKMIPRRAWVVVEAEGELLFCGPNCDRLYREYWLPRYGAKKP
jgi:hypothetical protein